MKTLRFTIALLAIPLAMIGCREPAGDTDLQDETETYPDGGYQEEERPLQPEGQQEESTELTEQQRQERQAFIDRTDEDINNLEDQLDQLEDRLGDTSEQIQTDVQPRVDALRGHLDTTRTRYEGWDEMSEQAFEQAQEEIDERIEEARNLYQEISERMDQGMVAPAAG